MYFKLYFSFFLLHFIANTGIIMVALWNRADHYIFILSFVLLVHGQVTIIFVVSVCLSVCLFVWLSVFLFVCAEFFSAVFDPILIKLGHMLYVWV